MSQICIICIVSCFSVVAGVTQAWWTLGYVLVGALFSRKHKQSFGSPWLQMHGGRTASLLQSLLSSADPPSHPRGRAGDGTLGLSPLTPAFRMPIGLRPNQLSDNIHLCVNHRVCVFINRSILMTVSPCCFFMCVCVFKRNPKVNVFMHFP